jgi:Cu/Ag efflux pump CusA
LAEEVDRGQSIAFGLAAALAVLLLMQAAVRSWRLAGLAYLTLPSALLGGIVALLLLGDGLSVATGAGLLAVFVLAVRNTLTTLDPIARGGDASDGALERFTPVVTSSLAIAATMLPFAVMGSGIGLEVLQPMAIVVLGGLATTLLHALLVVPALSAAFPAPEPDPDEEILEPVPADAEGSR